jgi:hypothetical protein
MDDDGNFYPRHCSCALLLLTLLLLLSSEMHKMNTAIFMIEVSKAMVMLNMHLDGNCVSLPYLLVR